MIPLLIPSFPLTFGLFLALVTTVQASEPQEKTSDEFSLENQPPNDLNSMAELRVELIGVDGRPVVGAAVRPYAMRVIEAPGHGYWDEQQFGPTKNYFSDDRGVAVIRFPAKIGPAPRFLTTKSVTFQVRHSDYVEQIVDFELGPDLDNPATETKVELKKGCELQLSAVDDNGAAISDFCVHMAGAYAPAFWAKTADGGRRTSAVSDGSWQTMLVAPQAQGPTLFSGLLPLRVRPSQAVNLRNVRMSPGTIVRGQISSNVPRPVLNGKVITTTAPKPAGETWDEESPSLTWYETTSIAENGTFTLPSIPRSGKIQIIAVCDGFVSETSIPEANRFVMGQLFDIDGPELAITVSMEPTATVEITILKPDGRPLESGLVSSSPNMRLFKGGSTLVGQTMSTLAIVRNQLLPAEQWSQTFRRETDLPFLNCPVVEGVATLRGLPVGALGGTSAVLQHDEFQFPVAAEGQQGQIGFHLDTLHPTRLTVTAVPQH